MTQSTWKHLILSVIAVGTIAIGVSTAEAAPGWTSLAAGLRRLLRHLRLRHPALPLQPTSPRVRWSGLLVFELLGLRLERLLLGRHLRARSLIAAPGQSLARTDSGAPTVAPPQVPTPAPPAPPPAAAERPTLPSPERRNHRKSQKPSPSTTRLRRLRPLGPDLGPCFLPVRTVLC